MQQSYKNVFVKSIAACVPSSVVLNDSFSELFSAKELKFFEKTTGIHERRYVENDVTASDLGYIAAKKILSNENCHNEIKALVFLSQTSDYKIPFTSNILQDRLGLNKNILCLDINAGCAGFVQGLSVVFSLLSEKNDKVLFIVAETLSKILSAKDKVTSTLFGDAGSAILVGFDKKFNNSTYFNFFSDGKYSESIIIPDGGYRNIISENSFINTKDEKGNVKNKTQLSMNGSKVFDFTLREIPGSIENILKYSDIDINDIDKFLFHQSNAFIIKQIASMLKLEKNKLLINIDKFGNTSGVSIPLLFVTNYTKSNQNEIVLLTGYGSGLNWGNCILPLHNDFITYDLIEY